MLIWFLGLIVLTLEQTGVWCKYILDVWSDVETSNVIIIYALLRLDTVAGSFIVSLVFDLGSLRSWENVLAVLW